MGKVVKRVRKDAKAKDVWTARWRDPDGRQHKKAFDKKVDADEHLLIVEGSLRDGTYVDPKAAKVKFGEWVEVWKGGQSHLKKTTHTRYLGIIKVQILPKWKDVPLVKIRHAAVNTWVSDLVASGLKPSTVRQVHRVFSMVLDLAVRDGRLPKNPAKGVRNLPQVGKAEKRYLTHDQVARLSLAAGEYGPVVDVLAYCGLRFGELVGLRVKRVDLMRRRLLITEAAADGSGKLVWTTTKGHTARWVPFPKFLTDDLTEACAGKGPEDLVFTGQKGGPLRNRTWRRLCFDDAAEAVGLKGLTPHELRHTAASLSVSVSAKVKAVQRMLGHKSAAMTLDVYSGLFDEDLDAVAERLDEKAVAARQVTHLGPIGQVADLGEKRKRA